MSNQNINPEDANALGDILNAVVIYENSRKYTRKEKKMYRILS